MPHKALIPDEGKRPTTTDGQKGYTGHKLPVPPPEPQTPSPPAPISNPQPTNSDKK